MSGYERNTTMVACILGVLIVGAVIVGAISYFGSWGVYSYGPDTDVHFSWDVEVGSTTGTVDLDIDIGVGSINLEFEDNASLLYRIHMDVPNRTHQQHGDPTVTFTSNDLVLNYEVAGVNITLGSALNYTLDLYSGTGSIAAALKNGTHVGNIALRTGTGSVALASTSDVDLVGSPDWSLQTSTGSIDVILTLPQGVEGSFEASTGTGSVDILAPGWSAVTPSHYETSGYDTASKKLTITAVTGTGSVDAILT